VIATKEASSSSSSYFNDKLNIGNQVVAIGWSYACSNATVVALKL
jgi:hypothetical protein